MTKTRVTWVNVAVVCWFSTTSVDVKRELIVKSSSEEEVEDDSEVGSVLDETAELEKSAVELRLDELKVVLGLKLDGDWLDVGLTEIEEDRDELKAVLVAD